MNEDCETFAFDQEEFKCQLIDQPVLQDNDIVSHLATSEAELVIAMHFLGFYFYHRFYPVKFGRNFH